MPSPKWTQQIRLTAGKRIDITNAPLPRNKLANRMMTFTGTFEVEPVEEGTRVVRTVRMDFTPWARPLAERILRGKLQPAVEDEIRLAKAYLETRCDR